VGYLLPDNPTSPSGGKQLVVYDASAVTPEPVEWLWPTPIPRLVPFGH
jgi:hypothetical protein